MTTCLAFWNIGGWEWLLLAALGLLIFGKRLPEVGRSLGKGIVEFKKGLSGLEDDLTNATNGTASNGKIPPAQDPSSATNQTQETTSSQSQPPQT